MVEKTTRGGRRTPLPRSDEAPAVAGTATDARAAGKAGAGTEGPDLQEVRQGLHAGDPRAKKRSVVLSRSAMLRRAGAAPAPASSQLEADIVAKLREIEEFRKFGKLTLESIAAESELRRLRAGGRLWTTGESARQVAIVLSGIVKLARKNLDGDSFTYGMFGPGDPVGVPALMANRRYPTDAVAMSNGVEVILINVARLNELARTDPAVGVALMRLLLKFIEVMRSKIEITSAGFVPCRLQVLMLYLADHFGHWDAEGHATVPLALTREQIAEIIGVRLETVVRELKRWEREGWIDISSRGYVIKHLNLVGGCDAGSNPVEPLLPGR
ncbi:MAG: hypothetical protein AUK49_11550 [Betaproteobacteria bacterium CG2_30_68_42]|nr:MAG: hypothetical protein AUK49_11550 [Betaproteobacteria bacterium CG2_30_68_42]PJA57916.1 MAG: hypothetical protein CO164_05355 [Rhodocyclales bacterium CG_4_9_14_3_um_filter_68_10]